VSHEHEHHYEILMMAPLDESDPGLPPGAFDAKYMLVVCECGATNELCFFKLPELGLQLHPIALVGWEKIWN
jgi:hypothetical protein